jgi:hypothetical protein
MVGVVDHSAKPTFSLNGLAGAVAGSGGDVKGVGEHGEGGVPVPGPVPAGLVVVEPGLAFRLGEAVLDSPSRACDRGELGQGDRAGRPAAEERQLEPALLARLQRPAGEQVMAGPCAVHLFGDFHESLLDKLDHPGPGIGVDLDPREQIFIPPVVDSRGRDRADPLVALVNSLETQDSLAPVTAPLGVDARRDG